MRVQKTQLQLGHRSYDRIHRILTLLMLLDVHATPTGSHAAHMLARCGVERLRLIDFDQVTLSSLNRHAFATHSDVGSTKVKAGVKHITAFAPRCKVEACPVMFTKENAPELLGGSPTFVIDCIDDADTKVRHRHSKNKSKNCCIKMPLV